MKEIIVYTSDFCRYCGAAKQWLQNNELDFTEINLDDRNEHKIFSEKYPYLRTSPQIFCDVENIVGFTDLIGEDPNDLR